MHSILFVPILFAAVSDPVELGNLKSTPPADWKVGRPTNTMQYRVFTVPKAEGDKDDTVLTIYTFGPNVGGLDANLKRWKGMIDPGDGKNIEVIAPHLV